MATKQNDTALDREVAAMQTVHEAMMPLDVAQRSRVIAWAQSRFGHTGKLTDSLVEIINLSSDEINQLKQEVAGLKSLRAHDDSAVAS